MNTENSGQKYTPGDIELVYLEDGPNFRFEAPADGEPVDMSELTLGPRYGSEDMYRDMGIVPGSRVAFEKDGVIYTDTVQEVRYTSPTAAIWPQLSLWQRILRRLTPRRFLKPLQPVREAELGGVTVLTGQCGKDVRQQYERHLASLQQAGDILTGLISNKPDTSGSLKGWGNRVEVGRPQSGPCGCHHSVRGGVSRRVPTPGRLCACGCSWRCWVLPVDDPPRGEKPGADRAEVGFGTQS